MLQTIKSHSGAASVMQFESTVSASLRHKIPTIEKPVWELAELAIKVEMVSGARSMTQWKRAAQALLGGIVTIVHLHEMLLDPRDRIKGGVDHQTGWSRQNIHHHLRMLGLTRDVFVEPRITVKEIIDRSPFMTELTDKLRVFLNEYAEPEDHSSNAYLDHMHGWSE